MIEIEKVDHIGIRVEDLDRALEFYAILGFEFLHQDSNDAVAIVKNAHDVEINLIFNANVDIKGKNILMDVGEKYPGYTHVALRVSSVSGTIAALEENGITITQGPVDFGDGHLSVFVRDPDRNVIELRGRNQDASAVEGVASYTPEN